MCIWIYKWLICRVNTSLEKSRVQKFSSEIVVHATDSGHTVSEIHAAQEAQVYINQRTASRDFCTATKQNKTKRIIETSLDWPNKISSSCGCLRYPFDFIMYHQGEVLKGWKRHSCTRGFFFSQTGIQAMSFHLKCRLMNLFVWVFLLYRWQSWNNIT